MKILQPSCNHVGKVGGTAKVYSQSDIDLLGGGEGGCESCMTMIPVYLSIMLN